MAYCKFIRCENQHVIYAYGATISDITGEVDYDFENGILKIVKRPEKYAVMRRPLEGIFKMQKKNFMQGKFAENLAYEA